MLNPINCRLCQSRLGLPVFVFVLSAIAMFTFEVLKELFLQDIEHWQSRAATILFTSALAATATWFISKTLQAFNQHVKALELKEVQLATHQTMMRASYHYICNVLNMISLVELELDEAGTVNQKTIDTIKSAVTKIQAELHELETLDNPTFERINDYLNEKL